MAIASVESKDDLSNLVNELGNISEDEEIEEFKDEDVCQNEGVNNLQDAYDSLLKTVANTPKLLTLLRKR